MHAIFSTVIGCSILLHICGEARVIRQVTTTSSAPPTTYAGQGTDTTVLNFALNLEYLEGEFYSHAVFGQGLSTFGVGTSGVGAKGSVRLPHTSKVTFNSSQIQQIATEIAVDERNHVKFLRQALGSAAVAEPIIDLNASFTALARAAGLINSTETFDPYASETNFLLASFVFEDVGVTAYKGGARLITSKDYLEAAAGILAVEAYHAGTIRTILFQRGLGAAANAISAVRQALSGPTPVDQGILDSQGKANIVPADNNSVAFSRTVQQVLDVVYGSANGTPGVFFPAGVNGVSPASTTNSPSSTSAVIHSPNSPRTPTAKSTTRGSPKSVTVGKLTTTAKINGHSPNSPRATAATTSAGKPVTSGRSR